MLATSDLDRLCNLGLRWFGGTSPGAYYGSAEGLSVGAGIMYSGVQYPVFDVAFQEYKIIEGLVLVITNECDTENDRAFADSVLACPIQSLEDLAEQFSEDDNISSFTGLWTEISKNSIFRVFYLPPPSELFYLPELPRGGAIYLNQISSIHRSLFNVVGVSAIGALSNYALQRFDYKITNHFLRPKAELLPITR